MTQPHLSPFASSSAVPNNGRLQIDLTEDQFIERFRPIPNPLDPYASFDFGEGGCLFSGVAAEFDFVRRQPEKTVWTLTESDGHLEISDGVHHVNRLGYIVTEIACPPDAVVTIALV